MICVRAPSKVRNTRFTKVLEVKRMNTYHKPTAQIWSEIESELGVTFPTKWISATVHEVHNAQPSAQYGLESLARTAASYVPVAASWVTSSTTTTDTPTFYTLEYDKKAKVRVHLKVSHFKPLPMDFPGCCGKKPQQTPSEPEMGVHVHVPEDSFSQPDDEQKPVKGEIEALDDEGFTVLITDKCCERNKLYIREELQQEKSGELKVGCVVERRAEDELDTESSAIVTHPVQRKTETSDGDNDEETKLEANPLLGWRLCRVDGEEVNDLSGAIEILKSSNTDAHTFEFTRDFVELALQRFEDPEEMELPECLQCFGVTTARRFLIPPFLTAFIEMFVTGLESCFKYSIQLLATMVMFWPFLFSTTGEPFSPDESYSEGLAWRHDTSPYCNNGFAKLDAVLSYLSTALFYLLLWPYLHMLLRTFAPGLKRVSRKVERSVKFRFESFAGDNAKMDSRDAPPFGMEFEEKRPTVGTLASIGNVLRGCGCTGGNVDWLFGERETPTGEGLRVRKVTPKSHAEEHNVKEGWRLLSLNEHKINSVVELRYWIRYYRESENAAAITLRFRVYRQDPSKGEVPSEVWVSDEKWAHALQVCMPSHGIIWHHFSNQGEHTRRTHTHGEHISQKYSEDIEPLLLAF